MGVYFATGEESVSCDAFGFDDIAACHILRYFVGRIRYRLGLCFRFKIAFQFAPVLAEQSGIHYFQVGTDTGNEVHMIQNIPLEIHARSNLGYGHLSVNQFHDAALGNIQHALIGSDMFACKSDLLHLLEELLYSTFLLNDQLAITYTSLLLPHESAAKYHFLGGAGNVNKSTGSDEEFEQARKTALNKGEVLAKVTDMTPGVSCAYTLFAPKFTVYWNAQFSTVGGDECKMVMEEVYDFPNHAFVQYLLSLLFVRQHQQHKAFRQEIERRLEGE